MVLVFHFFPASLPIIHSSLTRALKSWSFRKIKNNTWKYKFLADRTERPNSILNGSRGHCPKVGTKGILINCYRIPFKWECPGTFWSLRMKSFHIANQIIDLHLIKRWTRARQKVAKSWYFIFLREYPWFPQGIQTRKPLPFRTSAFRVTMSWNILWCWIQIAVYRKIPNPFLCTEGVRHHVCSKSKFIFIQNLLSERHERQHFVMTSTWSNKIRLAKK